MAKSLRAKSHLHAKSIKRHNEFQKVVDARADRVSEKLKQDLMAQKMKDLKSGDAMEVEDSKKDGEPEKKVSTSGWRDARHHNYKKAKKMKHSKKKGSFTNF